LRLALGTVQFGIDYGIANTRGKVPPGEAKTVLDSAWAAGIDTLDTAVAYGDSEARLGQLGVESWKVVSKLPAMPDDCGDVREWVSAAVRESLQRLRLKALYGLLLHRPLQLLGPKGGELYHALEQLKTDRVVLKTGVSIYDPGELGDLCRHFHFDLVQAPFSLLDRRLVDTGWLSRLAEQNTELHTRSVFLQGLLLMAPGQRPKSFDRWASVLGKYDDWLKATGLTRLEACIRYALSFPEISRVIVGVDGVDQLKEIVHAARGGALEPGDAFGTTDRQLLDPSLWAAAI
jgi:aryl-alcohol dehydrogenase-like predicted oxidoreductase